MYTEHYGLSARPFQLTPDPAFYFDSRTHRKAMAYLGYGLAQGEGFIVITGDIGAGKTTLVGHLTATIDARRLTVAKIVSTQVDGDDILRLAANAMGIASEGVAKAALLDRVERFLHEQARGGRRTLLIVDEAQNLSVPALEELRMLSNFTGTAAHGGGQALLQIFLLGQPEFRDALQGPGLEQLRQRVIATHHLEPMSADEVGPYIEHRLSRVGWTGRPRFTADACAALHAATGGVPRVINTLASRVLLHGAIEALDTIDGAAIASVVNDLAADVSDTREVPFEPSPLAVNDFAADIASACEVTVEHAPPVEEPVPLAAKRVAHRLAAVPMAPVLVEPVPVEQAPVDAGAGLAARVAAIEARLEEQEAALRRVLALLIDWVERDASPAGARRAGAA